MPITTQKSVEDVTNTEDTNRKDDLLEEGFFFLDEDCDSGDSDYDEEIDEKELSELKTEADIHRFNAILAEAQAVAVQAAKEAAELKPKRKMHYTGNSMCTVQHHAKKQRQLEAIGQKFINTWFQKKDSPYMVMMVSDDEAEGTEREDELEQPEIEEESINHLFLNPSIVLSLKQRSHVRVTLDWTERNWNK
ncbi:hypothetical protein BYT27DRAFT_7088096 [Phlegmacium glaucopus]|nr:hypothetical protein BYT27DRAFT_7088096 [Phlegmacium glaucopus]